MNMLHACSVALFLGIAADKFGLVDSDIPNSVVWLALVIVVCFAELVQAIREK